MRTIEIDEDWVFKATEGEGQYAIAVALMEIANAIFDASGAIDRLHESLRSDHPLQGETFEGLASAIGEVAEAIKSHE
jgi:hypothetical protein